MNQPKIVEAIDNGETQVVKFTNGHTITIDSYPSEDDNGNLVYRMREYKTKTRTVFVRDSND